MMKKADLKKIPRLYLTTNMYNTCIKDIGNKRKYEMEYKYSCYYRAAVHDNSLFIAIWTRKGVLDKRKEPEIEVYINKEDRAWINHNVHDDNWGKARIENMNYHISNYGNDWYWVKEHSTIADKKKVNAYFGYKGKQYSIREAVRLWQKEIAQERLQQVYRKELEEIDTVMENVPEFPKDFTKWAQTGAYCKSQSVVYNRKTKDAFCTACGRHFPAREEWRHNEEGICPKCRKKVMFKSYYKQKTLNDRKTVGIMLRLKNKAGYVIRIFNTGLIRNRDRSYKKEFWIYEMYRIQLDMGFHAIDTFEWTEYKNTGKIRWCHEKCKGYGYYTSCPDEMILYHKNLKELLKETELKYCDLHVLIGKNEGKYIRPVSLLQMAGRNPEIEVMIKSGLYRCAMDVCKWRNVTPKKWTGESIWKYLEITKDYYKMAVAHDCGSREISVMKSATERHVILAMEQIKFYTTYMHGLTDELFSMGHQEKLYKYLLNLKNCSATQMGDYVDYLHDLDYLKIPKTKAVLFPKNFMQEHMEIAEQAKEKRDKLTAMKQRKKDQLYKKTVLPNIKSLYEYEDETFKVIIPTCKRDFTVEGQQNHNCVGGVYFDKVLEEKSVVVFLRKKEDIESSYCTVEFGRSGRVLQNRAKYNGEAPEDAVRVINALSKRVQKELAKRKQAEIRKAEAAAAEQAVMVAG